VSHLLLSTCCDSRRNADPPAGPPECRFPTPQVETALRSALLTALGKYHVHMSPDCPVFWQSITRPRTFYCARAGRRQWSGPSAVWGRSGDEVILAAYDYKANFQDVLTGGRTGLIDVCPGQLELRSRAHCRKSQSTSRAIVALPGMIDDLPS